MQPKEIRLSQDKRVLTIVWDDKEGTLPAEFLRVESPSAEVRGHGNSPKKLVAGKQNISITSLEPMGGYAIKIVFSDGHDSGFYTWAFLRTLCDEHDSLWQTYVDAMGAAGLSRAG